MQKNRYYILKFDSSVHVIDRLSIQPLKDSLKTVAAYWGAYSMLDIALNAFYVYNYMFNTRIQ